MLSIEVPRGLWWIRLVSSAQPVLKATQPVRHSYAFSLESSSQWNVHLNLVVFIYYPAYVFSYVHSQRAQRNSAALRLLLGCFWFTLSESNLLPTQKVRALSAQNHRCLFLLKMGGGGGTRPTVAASTARRPSAASGLRCHLAAF